MSVLILKETSNAVMGAILIHDVRNEKGVANPKTPLEHPLCLFASGGFHGGVWRCGATIGSLGVFAALIYYMRAYRAYLGLTVAGVVGLIARPPHTWQ